MAYSDIVLARPNLLATYSLGGMARFAGTGVVVTQTDATTLNSTELGSAWTAIARVSFDSLTSADQTILGGWVSTSLLFYMDKDDPTANIRAVTGILPSGNVGGPTAPSGYTLAPATEVSVALVVDSTSQRVYVNGVLRHTTATGAGFRGTSGTAMAWGAERQSELTARALTGYLGYGSIYNVAYTDEQIAADYAALTGSEPSVGTGGVTAPAAAVLATGVRTLIGAASLDAPPVVVASQGAATTTGGAWIEVAPAGFSAVGLRTAIGSTSVEAPVPAIAVAGMRVIVGDAWIEADNPTVSASGHVVHIGAASVEAAAPSVSATGAVARIGAASISAAPATVFATGGVLPASGEVAVTAPVATVSATGARKLIGAAALEAPSASVSVEGVRVLIGAAAITAPAASVFAATAPAEEVTGTVSISVAPATLNISGIVRHYGDVSVTGATPLISAYTSSGFVRIIDLNARERITLKFSERTTLTASAQERFTLDTR